VFIYSKGVIQELLIKRIPHITIT